RVGSAYSLVARLPALGSQRFPRFVLRLLAVVAFRRPDVPDGVSFPARHKMDVQVEDRLTGRATVGLNDVEAIGVDCALDCCGEPRCCPGELLGSDFIKCPNVGHMEARDHKRVPEGSRIVREEGNDMLIAID